MIDAMATTSVYLSGWEFNRIPSAQPWDPVVSGLPAHNLWSGAVPFWMFENTYCTHESLLGDLAAHQDLGWETGRLFEDLHRRGFLKPLD